MTFGTSPRVTEAAGNQVPRIGIDWPEQGSIHGNFNSCRAVWPRNIGSVRVVAARAGAAHETENRLGGRDDQPIRSGTAEGQTQVTSIREDREVIHGETAKAVLARYG